MVADFVIYRDFRAQRREYKKNTTNSLLFLFVSSFTSKMTKKTTRKTTKKHTATLALLFTFVLIVVHVVSAKKSLPYSKQSIFSGPTSPWNASSKIDSKGFLTETYKRIPGEWEQEARIGGKYGCKSKGTKNLEEQAVYVRQVPGDGSCLFHACSAALSWVEDKEHLHYTDKCSPRRNVRAGDDLDIYTRSEILRQISVDMLTPTRKRKEKLLFLQGNEYLRTHELLNIAASQYGITGEQYCDAMKKSGVWGGGPEIVALSNYLRRPIHIYELISVGVQRDARGLRQKKNAVLCSSSPDSKQEFRLRRMACFGSPKFDSREPLHILSADCRFPDLDPGQEASAGNHFMALFPDRKRGRDCLATTKSGFKVRSGATFQERERLGAWASRSLKFRMQQAHQEEETNGYSRFFNKCAKLMRNNEEAVQEIQSPAAPKNPFGRCMDFLGIPNLAFTDAHG